MKRELKAVLTVLGMIAAFWIARLIPMKRELKGLVWCDLNKESDDRKAHPDEKGTESGFWVHPSPMPNLIARLIPMKRELKVDD